MRKKIIFSCFVFLIALIGNASAESITYNIRETISLPPGQVGIVDVLDMDGDGILDIVVGNWNTYSFQIYEQNGTSLDLRFNYNTGQYYQHARVADIDLDGFPELEIDTSYGGWVKLFEATGDNSYALRFEQTLGTYIEGARAGDSDGDGLLEFLIARESFPSRVYSLGDI